MFNEIFFNHEMERAALKCTKPCTNWWVLAHEIWEKKSTSHFNKWGRKAMAFQCLWKSKFLHLYIVVMSRPARERHILKWTLASWKRLPRRDTVHKNNLVTLGGQVCFSCSCGSKVLARRAVWPLFFELLMSVYVKDLVCFYSKVLKWAHEEAAVSFSGPTARSFQMSLDDL